MALTASQLAEAQAVAVQYINDEFPSVLSQSNALYEDLVKRKKYIDGGTKIQMPIVFEENLSEGFIDGRFDVLSNNQNQQLTFAELEWKYFYTNLSLTLDDFTKTYNTPQAVKSLIITKADAAKGSAVRTLSRALFESNSGAPNKFNGLADIFAPSGTAYAGISNIDVPNWLPEIDITTSVPNYTNIVKMMDELRERTGQYQGDADGNNYKKWMIISRQSVLSEFKSTEQIKQRYIDKDTLSAGFKGIEIDGAFWYADSFCQGSGTTGSSDNHIYIITPESMKLCYKYGLGKQSPLDSNQIIVNQPVKSNVSFFAGNLVCTNRRVNGVFKNIAL